MEQKNKKKISTQTIIKLLLAVVLLGLSAFLLKGDVDFLDLVASGGSDGICCNACYRKTVLAF